jgi:hypothetical protein
LFAEFPHLATVGEGIIPIAMSDDAVGVRRTPRDRTQIDVREPLEVRYWATMLRCSEAKLRAAVEAVGANVNNVRTYLEEA